MTEEINYSYDGGLYAEMVRNRTFGADWSGMHHWYPRRRRQLAAQPSTVDKQTGPSEALQVQPAASSKQADAHNQAGVLNDGWWGMPLRPNTTYKGSFYAKADSADLGPVTVSLVNDNSGKAVATAEVTGDRHRLEAVHSSR